MTSQLGKEEMVLMILVFTVMPRETIDTFLSKGSSVIERYKP